MKTHSGSCHCKKVQYDVDLDLAKPAIECNCSHCSAKGALLQFVPESSFTLKSGDDALQEYRFNTKKIQHLFCKECGVQSFSRGTDAEGNGVVAINVRAIEDADIENMPRTKVNGKDF